MSRSLPSPPHLLQRAAQGNREALSALVCARKERVHRLASALLSGSLEPELATSQAVNLEELAELSARSGGVKRWASQPAREEADERQAISGERPCVDADGEPTLSPQTLLGSWRLVHQLYRALLALPRQYREAMVLRDVEGLGYDQVAWLLDVSESTARERALHARALLRYRWAARHASKKSA